VVNTSEHTHVFCIKVYFYKMEFYKNIDFSNIWIYIKTKVFIKMLDKLQTWENLYKNEHFYINGNIKVLEHFCI
jgi:hypothetical protein